LDKGRDPENDQELVSRAELPLPVSTGMIARTKSVVIPVIIATISEDSFREILGDGSCRYAYDEKES
jgi:hypothetical protein